MDDPHIYQGLNFTIPRRRLSRRLIVVVSISAVFTLLWWIVSPAVLYWLLLPAVALMAWAASYGWREANAHLIRFLQHLQQL